MGEVIGFLMNRQLNYKEDTVTLYFRLKEGERIQVDHPVTHYIYTPTKKETEWKGIPYKLGGDWVYFEQWNINEFMSSCKSPPNVRDFIRLHPQRYKGNFTYYNYEMDLPPCYNYYVLESTEVKRIGRKNYTLSRQIIKDPPDWMKFRTLTIYVKIIDEDNLNLMDPCPEENTISEFFQNRVELIRVLFEGKTEEFKCCRTESDITWQLDQQEYEGLNSFVDYFNEIQPDVIECYTLAKLVFLFKRIRYRIKKINPKKVELFSTTAFGSSEFPYFLKPKDKHLHVDPEKEKKKLYIPDYHDESGFMGYGKNFPNLIVLPFKSFLDKTVNVLPWDVQLLHKTMQDSNYLELTMQATCSLGLEYYHYFRKSEFNLRSFLRFSKLIETPMYFEFDPKIEEEDIQGGDNFEPILGGHQKGRFVDIDINGAYMNGFVLEGDGSLSPENVILNPSEYEGDMIEVLYGLDDKPKKFYLRTDREGVVASYSRWILRERKRIDEKLQNPNITPAERKKLQIDGISKKLCGNSFYGCTARVGDYLYFPKAAGAVTMRIRKKKCGLEKFFESEGYQIVMGNTDGCMVTKKGTIDFDVQESMRKWEREHGDGHTLSVKYELSDLIIVSTSTYIGRNAKRGEFINKGVLTKAKTLIECELMAEIYPTLFKGELDSTTIISIVKRVFQNKDASCFNSSYHFDGSRVRKNSIDVIHKFGQLKERIVKLGELVEDGFNKDEMDCLTTLFKGLESRVIK